MHKRIVAAIVAISLGLMSNAMSTQIIKTAKAETADDGSAPKRELKIEKIVLIPDWQAKRQERLKKEAEIAAKRAKELARKKRKASAAQDNDIPYSAKYFKRRGVIRWQGLK